MLKNHQPIRQCQAADVNRILAIWLAASIQAHDFIAPDFWVDKIHDMRHSYIPQADTYVYTQDNQIQGFFSLVGDTLAAIFVNPAVQGQGIGKQLLDKAKSLRSTLTLTVYCRNTRSVAFYEKNGFAIAGEYTDEQTAQREFVMIYGK